MCVRDFQHHIPINIFIKLYNEKTQPPIEDIPDQASVEPYEQELHVKCQMQQVGLQPQLDHIPLALKVFSLSDNKREVSYNHSIKVQLYLGMNHSIKV